MDIKTIQLHLNKRYRRRLLVPVMLLAVLLPIRLAGLVTAVGPVPGRWLGPGLFIVAVALAGAMPVLLRTLFAHRWRSARHTPAADFERLQRRLIDVSLAAVWLLPVICLVEMPTFYQGGVILAALYGAYYHYPTLRRITFDSRIFRVSHDDSVPAHQA